MPAPPVGGNIFTDISQAAAAFGQGFQARQQLNKQNALKDAMLALQERSTAAQEGRLELAQNADQRQQEQFAIQAEEREQAEQQRIAYANARLPMLKKNYERAGIPWTPDVEAEIRSWTPDQVDSAINQLQREQQIQRQNVLLDSQMRTQKVNEAQQQLAVTQQGINETDNKVTAMIADPSVQLIIMRKSANGELVNPREIGFSMLPESEQQQYYALTARRDELRAQLSGMDIPVVANDVPIGGSSRIVPPEVYDSVSQEFDQTLKEFFDNHPDLIHADPMDAFSVYNDETISEAYPNGRAISLSTHGFPVTSWFVKYQQEHAGDYASTPEATGQATGQALGQSIVSGGQPFGQNQAHYGKQIGGFFKGILGLGAGAASGQPPTNVVDDSIAATRPRRASGQ